ncbi:Tat pathway signal sequence domain protein [Kitasatospora camelliae]|uniref:Tat pathway signal sequence domain protein n=1 Tax=Kitasatospora camelliae TaxID=3156397 RepID=A0AAU8JTK9_9ACTN
MSGGGELPDGVHGSLGPVEPAEGTWAASARPHDPGAPPGRPLDRLTSGIRLTRRQRYAAAALLLLLATASAGRPGQAPRPEQAANSPPPYPAQITRFSYGGPTEDGAHPFVLRLTATDEGAAPVEVLGLHQPYPGLLIRTSGPLPVAIPPGGSVELPVVFTVTDCATAPADAELPFIDVTLRNTRAIQTVSQILGSAYARELSRIIHIACPDSGIRTSTSAPPFPDGPVR